jgi:MFS family permease
MASRVLTRYVVTAVCVRLADEGARVAIVLLALARTGHASAGGLLVAALMIPHVVAAPAAGAAADVVRRRKPVYLAAFAGYGVLLAASAVLIGPATWLAAIALAAAGCCAPLLIGGLSSLLGEFAPGNLERAYALDATSYGAAGIAGPAVAAVVAGWAGAQAALVTLGVLVLLGGVVLATLPVPVREMRGDRPTARTLLAALPVMWHRRPLGAITLAMTLNAFGVGAMPLVAALLAQREGRTALTGLILSVTAFGGLISSLLCARFPIRRRPERVLLACVAGGAPLYVIAAALPAGWAQLPVFALIGLMAGPMAVAQFSVRDRESPPQVRTQVFTLGAGLKVSGAAAGAAVAGLTAGVGPVVLLIAIGLCQVVAAGSGVGILTGGGLGHASVARVEEYR